MDYYHGIGPWYGQYRWNTKRELGGSALLTAGCHALDALLLCMGSDVEEVTSYATQSTNPVFSAYEYPTTSDDATASSRTGASANALPWSTACSRTTSTHTWSAARAAFSTISFHSQKLAGLNRNAWSELSMKMLDSGDVADHPYQTQFQAFFDALDRGEDMPLTSFDDAFITHRVIAAADRSAAEKRPVRISEIPLA